MKRIFSSRLFGVGAAAVLALAVAGIGATAFAQGSCCQAKMMQASAGADASGAPKAPMATMAQMPPMAPMAPGAPGAMMQRGPLGGRGGDRMLDRLNLSDQQRETIGKIREDGKAAALPLRKEMMRARNELRGEMLKDEPSAQRVREIAKRIGDLRTELQLQRIDQQFAIRKQLTPEQRDQMLAMGPGFDPEGDDDAGGPGRQGGMRGPRGGMMNCMPGGGGACDPAMCMPGGACNPMMCMPGGGCSMMSQGSPDFQVMPEGGWGQGGGMMCMPGGAGGGACSPMMCMPGGGCGQGGAMMCMPGGGCGQGGAMMCKPGGGCGHAGREMKAGRSGCCKSDDGAKRGKHGRGDLFQ